MSLDDLEGYAVRALAEQARRFAKLTPRKNASGAYGRALADLLEAARAFAQRSDEAWAGDVAELRTALDKESAS